MYIPLSSASTPIVLVATPASFSAMQVYVPAMLITNGANLIISSSACSIFIFSLVQYTVGGGNPDVSQGIENDTPIGTSIDVMFLGQGEMEGRTAATITKSETVILKQTMALRRQFFLTID